MVFFLARGLVDEAPGDKDLAVIVGRFVGGFLEHGLHGLDLSPQEAFAFAFAYSWRFCEFLQLLS